jgi:hypothetical protein
VIADRVPRLREAEVEATSEPLKARGAPPGGVAIESPVFRIPRPPIADVVTVGLTIGTRQHYNRIRADTSPGYLVGSAGVEPEAAHLGRGRTDEAVILLEAGSMRAFHRVAGSTNFRVAASVLRSLLAAVLLIGVGASCSRTGVHSGSDEVGPPSTIDELVSDLDIVLIGTVGPPGTQFPVIDFSPELTAGVPESEFADAQRYETEFPIYPEEVILDVEGVLSGDQPLTIRDGLGPPYPEVPVGRDGHIRESDRYLMLIVHWDQDEDGIPDYYGMPRGARTRFYLDGDYPVDGYGDPVFAARGMNTTEFLAAIRASVASQHGIPTPDATQTP